jgi:pseudolysin
MIKGMYQDWYHLPVLTTGNGKPMLLTMVVHEKGLDNAYWDGEKMTFGDGQDYFYPLTSLGVAAHEISHGFTSQHSDLEYYGQSGGMNESFSDMAAISADIYAYGKTNWQIGAEIVKQDNTALRYLDQPSKDCGGLGSCSIDDASQYNSGLDVHESSGVYNHLFYLLATSPNWDAHKAFNVMVQANMSYWTPTTNFASGACGIIKAAKDYDYDIQAVENAIKAVKIDISNC